MTKKQYKLTNESDFLLNGKYCIIPPHQSEVDSAFPVLWGYKRCNEC